MKKLKFVLLVFISILFAQNYCAYGYYTVSDYGYWIFIDYNYHGGPYNTTDTWKMICYTTDKVEVMAALSFGKQPPLWGTFAMSTAILYEGPTVVTTIQAELNSWYGTDKDEWIKPTWHPGCDKVVYTLEGYSVPYFIGGHIWYSRPRSWIYIWSD